MPGRDQTQVLGFPGACPDDSIARIASVGKSNPVNFNSTAGRTRMGDTGWLIVAIVAGLLAVIGWIVRERWIIRRRRRR